MVGDCVVQLGTGEFPDKSLIRLKDLSASGFEGDTTICFDSSILKLYEFPQIEKEKFITESFLYDQIDHDGYNYILSHDIFIICEYLEDGYSMNIDRISYENPVGRMYCEAQNMEYATALRSKIIAAAKYNQYRVISKHKHIRAFSFGEHIVLGLTYPIGILSAYKKRKRLEERHAGDK